MALFSSELQNPNTKLFKIRFNSYFNENGIKTIRNQFTKQIKKTKRRNIWIKVNNLVNRM